MFRIELIPSLSHCIETVTKEAYQEAVTECLGKEEADATLGEKIEPLRAFLDSADFRELRRESERYLVQGSKVKFLIYLEDGKLRHEMLVE